MPRWVQKVGPDGKSVFVPVESSGSRVHHIMPDIEPYESPVTGEIVSGRRQRREDLKRHGCVEYDPGMRRDAAVKRRLQEHKRVEKMIETMRWIGA